MTDRVPLTELDLPLARAAVVVLRHDGIDAVSTPLDGAAHVTGPAGQPTGRAGGPGVHAPEHDTVGDQEEAATVLVPAGSRERAWSVLAEHMETVRALADEEADRPEGRVARLASGAGAGGERQRGAEEGTERPLVMERLRRLGFISVALAPLLVVTLANVRLPGAYMVALLVGGAAAIMAYRSGRFGGRDRPRR